MTGTNHQNNLAARIGGWSARHRKAAVLAWFGFVEFLFFIVILALAYVYIWRKGALEWQ